MILKRKGLLSKVLTVLTTRPLGLWPTARGYFLFALTRRLRPLFLGVASGVSFGRNVRLQKLRCVSAERPGASVALGDHTVVYENAQIAAYGSGRIEIGSHSIIGDVRIYARDKITIGKRAVFSWNVFLQDFTPHPIEPALRARQLESMAEHFQPAFDGHKAAVERFAWEFPTDPIVIGDDVWFGANTTVLPGARIGAGSIVAAGAVVTRGEYPNGSILAGNPARVVKSVG